ncbi:MAG: hypothetical protein IH994_04340 [Proteobacteria bacterium]|nr:hypothetical protein [Pseudomonadota bacterium]
MFSSSIDPKIKTPGVLFFVLAALGLILIPGAAVAKETDREALALGERFREIVTNKDPPRKPGAAIIERGESNEQFFVKKKGKLFLTYPCPTPENFVKIANELKLEKKARSFIATLDPALVKKIKRTLDEKSLKETMKLIMESTGQDENMAYSVIQILYFQ